MNLLWCLVSVTAMTRVVYTVCTVGGVCTLDWVIVGEGMEGEREVVAQIQVSPGKSKR